MSYTELEFLIAPVDPWRDVLIAELGELGYDSFEETHGGMRAYIPSDRYERAALNDLLAMRDPHVRVSMTVREVKNENCSQQMATPTMIPAAIPSQTRGDTRDTW